jgi:cobalt-zinc-cadmium efflux system membrane fusion protein
MSLAGFSRRRDSHSRRKQIPITFLTVVAIAVVIALTTGCGAADRDRDAPAAAATQDVADEAVERDPNRLWCNEHDVYEDECVICHPEIASKAAEKRDPNRLWCNEHGLYEDECTICHPELAEAAEERDPNRLWCNEHGLYEDECTICHPELASDSEVGQDRTAKVSGLWCNEHDVAENECGLCHPELVAGLEPGQGMKVRFISNTSISKAGIEVGRPGNSTMFESLEVLGQVTFDSNKLAVITPLADGVVESVLVDVGDRVSKGDVLAQINSPAIAVAKSALVRALTQEDLHRQTYAREKDLVDREISAKQDVELAKAAHEASRSEAQEARQQLLNLGFTEDEVTEVVRTNSTTSTMLVRAPFDATVVEREAVAGSAVETGTMLFQIADLGTMWLKLSIPERHLAVLKRGMPVSARFEAYPSDVFEGELTWVAYQVDEATRKVEARAVLPNPDERLRHGMFAKVQLATSDQVAGLSVPKASVQMVDGRSVIFTKLAEDLYESRIVQLGPNTEGQVLVLAGLRPDDEIVVSESYLVKSELLKARLGAGCTDH